MFVSYVTYMYIETKRDVIYSINKDLDNCSLIICVCYELVCLNAFNVFIC